MISQKPKVQSHFVTYISVKDNSKINDKLNSKCNGIESTFEKMKQGW